MTSKVASQTVTAESLLDDIERELKEKLEVFNGWILRGEFKEGWDYLNKHIRPLLTERDSISHRVTQLTKFNKKP